MNYTGNIRTLSTIENLTLNSNILKETSTIFITLFPILFFVCLIFILMMVIFYGEGNLRNSSRILIYLIIEYIAMPFLIFFLVLNIFTIMFSYLFCNTIVYISTKVVFDYFTSCCRNDTVEVIKIKKAPVNNESRDEIVPNRADKYRDMDQQNDFKITNNVLNITDNRESKFNMNLSKITDTQSKQITQNINVINVKKKGKMTEFLDKYLMNEDNTPSYINFIRNIKNKSKEVIEEKSNDDVVTIKIKK